MKKHIISALAVLTPVFSLSAQGEEASFPAANNENGRYPVSFALDWNNMDIMLTLLNDSNAVLTAADTFTCG